MLVLRQNRIEKAGIKPGSSRVCLIVRAKYWLCPELKPSLSKLQKALDDAQGSTCVVRHPLLSTSTQVQEKIKLWQTSYSLPCYLVYIRSYSLHAHKVTQLRYYGNIFKPGDVRRALAGLDHGVYPHLRISGPGVFFGVLYGISVQKIYFTRNCHITTFTLPHVIET